MFYEEFHQNQSQTIVFLHGANTGGWMWEHVVGHLNDYHCVAVDFPGHDNSKGESWVSMQSAASDVVACIEQCAHDSRAHVVGLSLGGYVALRLLAHRPDRLGSVVISGVPGKAIPYRLAMRGLGMLMAPFIHTDSFSRMGARSMNVPEADVPLFRERSKRNTRQAFLSINRDALAFKLPQAALATPNPKLFVAGGNEHPIIKDSLQTFAAAKNAAGALVPDLGHGWSAEDPELFAAVVRSWIENQTVCERLTVVPQAETPSFD
ncbi:MAG: alpha/beta hydrolase [Pseudomonadota bacterium]